VECRHSDSNAKNLVLRVAFDPAYVKNPIQLRFLEDKVLDTVLTGVSGLGRVHIRSVKDEILYDPKTGGYMPSEQYVLDVEGTNLYDLLVFPGVDGTRTFSNDIHEVHDVFGIEAARLCLYEEIKEVFASEKVNYHHVAVLVDTMTFSGRIVPVNRTGMKKNETGVLAKSSFEETSKVMFNAATWAEADNMRGVSANIMFGQKPPCGTGFVDILIDETRLPDGLEDMGDEQQELLEQVNKRLETIPDTECRMEDILMEW
jgi:DNA-directed RNA polymerase II subunit RPB1